MRMATLAIVGRFAAKMFAVLASIGLFGAFLFLLADRIEMAPENAQVVVDFGTLTYASNPCVVHGNLEREVMLNRKDIADPAKPLLLIDDAHATRIGEVREGRVWKPDNKCNAADGFTQTVTFWNRLFGYRSRWTSDGEWLW